MTLLFSASLVLPGIVELQGFFTLHTLEDNTRKQHGGIGDL